MGKTPTEEAYVMMLCEEAHDFRITSSGIFYGPQGESQEERKKFVETFVAEHFKKFDTYLGKHQTKFAVSDQPTVADFQLYEYIDTALALDGARDLLDKYSNLKRFMETVRALPEIKDYIAKAHAELPLNNKGTDRGIKFIFELFYFYFSG